MAPLFQSPAPLHIFRIVLELELSGDRNTTAVKVKDELNEKQIKNTRNNK